MEKYHLYQTGIKVATFSIEAEVKIKLWDIFAGKWQPEIVFNQEHEEFLKRYVRADIGFILEHLENYKAFVSEQSHPEWVKTSWGSIYSEWTLNLWAERQKNEPLDIVIQDQQFVGLVTTNREFTTVFIKEGHEDATILKEWKEHQLMVDQPYGVKKMDNAMVKMRDGVHLSTEIWLPDSEKTSYPVIMARTPYGKERYSESHYRFVQRGYAVVLQDVRGRNDSEGNYTSMAHEREDGDDTLNWLVQQEWCDGEIGMLGGSYGGFVQWAAASSGNPHLKALVSIVTAGSPFVDMRRKGGALISGGIPLGFALSEKKFNPDLMIREDWAELMKIRPLEKIAEVGLGHPLESFNEALKHKSYDEYWDTMNWFARKEAINVPALIISGWYDDNGAGTTEAIQVTTAYPKNKRKIILGPWLHKGNANRDLGEIALGNAALRHDIDLQHLLWFERFLKNNDNGVDTRPAIEYYTVNENKWKTATQWPPEFTQEETYYLTSTHDARSSSGDGKLIKAKSEKEKEDYFTYDPDHPVPHLINLSENEICFPNDYHAVEKRQDVLCYTTEPFVSETTITGQIKVGFYAKSTAVDTDWVVRLTDVSPNGTSTNLAEGILCARFRESFSQPSYLVPNEVYYYEIETSKISNQFFSGHQLRLDITSSAENYIFPHSNTKKGPNAVKTIPADQTILSGGKYPSKLTLMVEK